MKKNYDDLFEETYNNVAKDRARLEKILTEVSNISSLTDLPVAATVEISECLIKANAQLIEMLKLEAKKKSKEDSDEDDDEITDDDRKAMWNEIEGKEDN